MSLFVDIEKTLGAFRLQVRFEAAEGVLALLGASGCGKSLTLGCIAGIQTPDKGVIRLDGRTLFDSAAHINLPPQKRKVGMLFQSYALFPNMSVAQNIACGLRDRNNKAAVEEMLHTMGLTHAADRKPRELSGGEQQRTALARILVNEPEVLLLDEPFSALDSHLRFRMEQEVHAAIDRFAKPVVLVSHDRDEVFRLSDRIAIMEKGQLDAIGEKRDIFANPRTLAGARLTGCKNISPIHTIDDTHVYAENWALTLRVRQPIRDATHIGIRMHHLLPGDGAENTFSCPVEALIESPFSTTVLLRPQGSEQALGMEVPGLCPGKAQMRFHIPPEAILPLRDGKGADNEESNR